MGASKIVNFMYDSGSAPSKKSSRCNIAAGTLYSEMSLFEIRVESNVYQSLAYVTIRFLKGSRIRNG
jgi:hypothetical protein